jgi:uncharacterized coiled-coil DUF342 family protein
MDIQTPETQRIINVDKLYEELEAIHTTMEKIRLEADTLGMAIGALHEKSRKISEEFSEMIVQTLAAYGYDCKNTRKDAAAAFAVRSRPAKRAEEAEEDLEALTFEKGATVNLNDVDDAKFFDFSKT